MPLVYVTNIQQDGDPLLSSPNSLLKYSSYGIFVNVKYDFSRNMHVVY